MRTKILSAVGTLAVTAAVFSAVATAGSGPKQERISISLPSGANSFVLKPLTSGPVHADSGTVSACCWTRRYYRRDGQAIEIDNPTVTFKGARGTFVWHERITFIDSSNDYTVATGVWKIARGTGAYAHLEGRGREAMVIKTQEGQNVADEVQGLVDLGRKG